MIRRYLARRKLQKLVDASREAFETKLYTKNRAVQLRRRQKSPARLSVMQTAGSCIEALDAEKLTPCGPGAHHLAANPGNTGNKMRQAPDQSTPASVNQ